MNHVLDKEEIRIAVEYYLNKEVLKKSVEVTNFRINHTPLPNRGDNVEKIEFATVEIFKDGENENAKK